MAQPESPAAGPYQAVLLMLNIPVSKALQQSKSACGTLPVGIALGKSSL